MKVKEQNHQDLIDILTLCSSGISVLGSNDFKLALNNMVVSHGASYIEFNSTIDYLFECVIEEWKEHKWKKEDFLKKNKRGEIVTARNIIIVLMRTRLKMSLPKIIDYFGMAHKQQVSTILSAHKRLNKNHKLESKLLEKYERLNIKILTYIDNLKSHSNG